MAGSLKSYPFHLSEKFIYFRGDAATGSGFEIRGRQVKCGQEKGIDENGRHSKGQEDKNGEYLENKPEPEESLNPLTSTTLGISYPFSMDGLSRKINFPDPFRKHSLRKGKTLHGGVTEPSFPKGDINAPDLSPQYPPNHVAAGSAEIFGPGSPVPEGMGGSEVMGRSEVIGAEDASIKSKVHVLDHRIGRKSPGVVARREGKTSPRRTGKFFQKTMDFA